MNIDNIAAQLFTVRDFCKTPKGFDETLDKLEAIGYKSIQVSAIGFFDYKFVKESADRHKMVICATHTPFERLTEDFEGVVKEHRHYGCDTVGIGYLPPKYERSKQGYTEFAREMSELGGKYRDEGIKLVYHNHRFEFEKYSGRTGLDIILEESKPENFGFIPDTYWIVAGGADPLEWIKKVRGRCDVIHFKDMAVKGDNQVMAEIGRGNLEWGKIIGACEENEIKWAAVEQDICEGDPFDSLKISYDNLKKMLEEK